MLQTLFIKVLSYTNKCTKGNVISSEIEMKKLKKTLKFIRQKVWDFRDLNQINLLLRSLSKVIYFQIEWPLKLNLVKQDLFKTGLETRGQGCFRSTKKLRQLGYFQLSEIDLDIPLIEGPNNFQNLKNKISRIKQKISIYRQSLIFFINT